jgi:hypothetical protein
MARIPGSTVMLMLMLMVLVLVLVLVLAVLVLAVLVLAVLVLVVGRLLGGVVWVWLRCRCCVVGARRCVRCWVRLVRCGCVVWVWIGVGCLRGLVGCGWGCRRMRFSGSTIGFGRRLGVRVLGMSLRRVRLV